MTIQMAFYEGKDGPTDILLCADRAQPRYQPATGQNFAGRMDVFKIGRLDDECAISCGGGTVHQNLFLSRLLRLPETPGDDIDYMDQLGRGLLGDAGLCLDQALRRTKAILSSVSGRILNHQHPKLSIILCGRDCHGTPRIYSWTADDRFEILYTPHDMALVIEPEGLDKQQETELRAAIAIGRPQIDRARIAIGYCSSVIPVLVSKRFHYARMSDKFFIRSDVGDPK